MLVKAEYCKLCVVLTVQNLIFNLQVIPGHGSNYVDLTFTALSTDEVFEEMDLAGFAFGYLSLDKAVRAKLLIHI